MNEPISAIRDVEVAGLTADSRAVRPGFLFAALPGARVDGRDYIDDAISRGAAAILAPSGTKAPNSAVALVTHPHPRREFAYMAARFFEAQPRTIAAVTGTNGKSSVVGFARQIWAQLGLRAASLGTLGLEAPGLRDEPGLTTPDPVSLHRQLAELTGAGITHLALEASSHGLEQSRLDGVRIGAAAFTNLSRDHLDYHVSMEAYLQAKARLFKDLLPTGGVAVLNADSDAFTTLRDVCRAAGHEIVTYGHAGGDIRLVDMTALVDGMRLCLTVHRRGYETNLPLLGGFQASNVLAALGLVIGLGADPGQAVAALPMIKGIRGRMEIVTRHPNGARICVDYAHTPDALDTALGAMRPHVRGKLVAVFGAGGDRDKGKRPLMGAAGARHADLVIVTDDNPRTEDARQIRRQVLAGCPGAREIGDRAEAIARAVAGLEADDALLIAGKGHESGQIVGTTIVPFLDANAARDAVAHLTSKNASTKATEKRHG